MESFPQSPPCRACRESNTPCCRSLGACDSCIDQGRRQCIFDPVTPEENPNHTTDRPQAQQNIALALAATALAVADTCESSCRGQDQAGPSTASFDAPIDAHQLPSSSSSRPTRRQHGARYEPYSQSSRTRSGTGAHQHVNGSQPQTSDRFDVYSSRADANFDTDTVLVVPRGTLPPYFSGHSGMQSRSMSSTSGRTQIPPTASTQESQTAEDESMSTGFAGNHHYAYDTSNMSTRGTSDAPVANEAENPPEYPAVGPESALALNNYETGYPSSSLSSQTAGGYTSVSPQPAHGYTHVSPQPAHGYTYVSPQPAHGYTHVSSQPAHGHTHVSPEPAYDAHGAEMSTHGPHAIGQLDLRTYCQAAHASTLHSITSPPAPLAAEAESAYAPGSGNGALPFDPSAYDVINLRCKVKVFMEDETVEYRMTFREAGQRLLNIEAVVELPREQ